MPLYEYQCTKCDHRFEVIQKFSDAPRAKCPKCKGPLRKLISAPAIQFKGSGWYVTDYGRKEASDSAKPAQKPGDAGDAKSEDKPKPAKESAPAKEPKKGSS